MNSGACDRDPAVCLRGQPKVAADSALLAAAVNLARLAVLGLTPEHDAWRASTA